MRIQIFSDLHLELAPFTLPQPRPQVDVVILAGDIHSPGHKVPRWARRESVFGNGPEILFVPGNHDYYGTVVEDEIEAMREECEKHRVTFMHAGDCAIGNVRFIGCTLWTDFALHGYADINMTRAQRAMNDYLQIERRAPPRQKKTTYPDSAVADRPGPIVPLGPEDTIAWHWMQRNWLKRKLAMAPGPDVSKTVVITHHAPSGRSVPPQYENHYLSPAYASELLEDLISTAAQVPALWVHGHIHNSMDYIHESGCRVLSNPRGYNHGEQGGWENHRFDTGLIVHI